MDDSSSDSQLNLVVGSLFTTRPEEDRAQYEQEREWIYEIQDMLGEQGIEVDLLSRPGVEIWEGGIDEYKDLYQLRLLAAYLEQGRDLAPVLGPKADLENEADPLLIRIWDGEQETRFPHLIVQQPDRVYYLPAEFDAPIWPEFDDEEDEDLDAQAEASSFGSSIALQRELAELEDLMKGALVPLNSPPYRCLLTLRQGADVSVANDLPLIIW